MRLLLDTHAFLWFVSDSPQLTAAAARHISDARNQALVSLGSIWEMAIKSSLGKLKLATPFQEFVEENMRANRFEFLPIQDSHLYRLVGLPLQHRDPFDRLIAAQCLAEELDCISADSILDAYGVRRIW